MPNRNNPTGFELQGRTLGGGMPTFQPMVGLASLATAFRPGDIVFRNAAGNIDRTGTPGTTLISGVCMEARPASTLRTVAVCAQPDAIFRAQMIGPTGAAAADMGLNANIVLGSTSTRLSDDGVDDTTEAVTASLDLHLLRKSEEPVDNDFGQWVKVLVVINKHRMNPVAVGV